MFENSIMFSECRQHGLWPDTLPDKYPVSCRRPLKTERTDRSITQHDKFMFEMMFDDVPIGRWNKIMLCPPFLIKAC